MTNEEGVFEMLFVAIGVSVSDINFHDWFHSFSVIHIGFIIFRFELSYIVFDHYL